MEKSNFLLAFQLEIKREVQDTFHSFYASVKKQFSMLTSRIEKLEEDKAKLQRSLQEVVLKLDVALSKTSLSKNSFLVDFPSQGFLFQKKSVQDIKPGPLDQLGNNKSLVLGKDRE